MLANEIYSGDRLLQKKAPVDYITKKPDISIEFKSFYIRDDHEPSVDRTLWYTVQRRLNREKDAREKGVNKRESSHFLYGIIFCGECGAAYTRKTVRGISGVRQKIWKCRERLSGSCKGAIITEDELLWRITVSLGWEWRGTDNFDDKRFLSEVALIEIHHDGIWLVRKEAA